MFGEFLGLFMGGAFGIGKMFQNADNEYNRAKAREEGKPFYWDNKGRRRNVDTGNVLIEKEGMSNGHRWFFDSKTGVFCFDLDHLSEIEENEERLKKGKKFIMKTFPNFPKHLDDNYRWVSCRKRVDIENNMPYSIQPDYAKGKATLVYYDPEGKGYEIVAKREITIDELGYYM